MSRPRPQILTLRYHPDRTVQWHQYPEPKIGPNGADPTIRFCGPGLACVLGRRLGTIKAVRLRVSAGQRRGARQVTLDGGSYRCGFTWRMIRGVEPLPDTLPRIRAFLTRVLGRPPVCGDVVWVEVLP